MPNHLSPATGPGPAVIVVYLACTLWGVALGLAAGFGLWHTATQANPAVPQALIPLAPAQTATAIGPTTP